MTKKKVGVYSNSSLARTGFGKHARILLQWLNANGYDAFEMAAGYPKGEPRLQGLPWRAYGLTLSDPRLNQEGIKQLNGYGAFGLEEVINLEKPDAVIAIEDSWAWQGLLGRSIYKQNPDNWIFWSPQDSLPLLDSQVEFAKEVKHFAVKAPFAQKAFKESGVDVDFWGALSDFKKYYPSHSQGLEIKRKSSIEDSTLIFGFVFRNQLRKLVTPLIQGFKLFKDRNPEKKAMLVFHTDPTESWNIPRIQRLEGLEKSDIYFTTICPACKDVRLGEFLENKTICTCCGRGELSHPHPNNGISEEELNKIYNSFDAYIHPVNSGGAEFCLAEAIHSGILSATVNYSYGEMYIESNLVESLPFSWYHEVNSSFKKAHPLPEGICNFMEKVANLSEDEKSEQSQKLRKWALEFFDTEPICKKVAAAIDSLSAPDYNYSFPNIDPGISKVEDNEQWIKETYYSFFGESQPGEQDFNFLKDALNRGATRESLYKQSQDIAKAKITPFNPKQFFKENGKKRLLVGLEKSIGDCLILLNVLDELHKKYDPSEWSIYILTSNENKHIFEHLDYIDGFLPPHQAMNTYFYEGSAFYEKLVDIYLQPFKATQSNFGWTHNSFSL